MPLESGAPLSHIAATRVAKGDDLPLPLQVPHDGASARGGARQDVLNLVVPAQRGDLPLLHSRVLERWKQAWLLRVCDVPDADVAVLASAGEEVAAEGVELQALHGALVLLERADERRVRVAVGRNKVVGVEQVHAPVHEASGDDAEGILGLRAGEGAPDEPMEPLVGLRVRPRLLQDIALAARGGWIQREELDGRRGGETHVESTGHRSGTEVPHSGRAYCDAAGNGVNNSMASGT